jgi:hypothetical protein
MRRYGHAPDPTEVEPYPGAPRYFLQAWDTRRGVVRSADRATGQTIRTTALFPPDAGVLEIVGFAARSPFPEDAATERHAFERHRAFMGWCFSAVVPVGELGFVRLAEVVELERDEFEAALDRLGHRLSR